MQKLFYLTLCFTFGSIFLAQAQSDACSEIPEAEMMASTHNYRHLSELPAEERKAAIIHMLTTGDCEYNGIQLHGKVEFVDSFPDIKIEFVESFPDIKVKFVDSFPDDCGEWQKVTSFPDFKVQVVTSFPDLKVQKVSSFPGMN